MPFTSMDQHYHNTIMASKIYLMMRIIAYLYGDVFFLKTGYLTTQHKAYLIMLDSEKHEKICLLN